MHRFPFTSVAKPPPSITSVIWKLKVAPLLLFALPVQERTSWFATSCNKQGGMLLIASSLRLINELTAGPVAGC